MKGIFLALVACFSWGTGLAAPLILDTGPAVLAPRTRVHPPVTPEKIGLQVKPSMHMARRPDARAKPRDKATDNAPLDLNRATALSPVEPVTAWQPTQDAPVPDRWRILDNLGLIQERWYDPYAQNTLKGDKPIRKHDEFLVLSLISDTVYEPRQVATPVGAQATTSPGSTGIFGGQDQYVFVQNLIVGLVYLHGNTTFKPPDFEFHFTPVFNFNQARVEETRALRIDPRASLTRRETHVGLQELFVDFHLRNVGARYDFDSFRAGVQPISLDFRGFLFQELPIAVRLFGNRDNNLWQYNLLWARRLEKDTNSGLNDPAAPLREDDVFAANLYRQDWPVLGFTSQAIVAHNRNREGDEPYFNENGFIERPASLGLEKGRDYDATYVGYNGDGRWGRTNLSVSLYGVFGRETRGIFLDEDRHIAAGFAAAEASWDINWNRLRVSALYATGENDPYDDTANGFDAIAENPIFAGADTSYWIRQSVPLIGGGGVSLQTRNGLLTSLRSSIQHGQSNFTNPGLILFGLGSDHDLAPTLRFSTNFNHLRFADTTVLEVARNQGGIESDIGWDLSAAIIWRPFMQQNIVARLSYAHLLPGAGFRDLFPDQDAYSLLANLTLTY